MGKNILIVNGSPREKGNSIVLAKQALEGAREAGASVESVFLHKLDIRACDACDECANTGVCVIKDDMQSLYPKVASADAIVLASPIYWFTYSAQMKLFIDRLYAFQNTHWKELEGKQFGIVLVYGDTDPYDAGVANAIHAFESMCRYLKADIVGIVHGTASDLGDAEKNPDLLKRAFELGKLLAQ